MMAVNGYEYWNTTIAETCDRVAELPEQWGFMDFSYRDNLAAGDRVSGSVGYPKRSHHPQIM